MVDPINPPRESRGFLASIVSGLLIGCAIWIWVVVTVANAIGSTIVDVLAR